MSIGKVGRSDIFKELEYRKETVELLEKISVSLESIATSLDEIAQKQ